MPHLNASVFSDSDSVCPFDSLPTEVISYIFYSLSYKDLKLARMVCYKWYLASLDPKLTSKEKFVIEDKINCPLSNVIFLDRLHEIKESRRDFFHLEIKGPLEWCGVQFFSEAGHKLKSLTLWPSIGSKDFLFEFLHHCPNLQHLSIRIENIVFSLNEVSCLLPRIFPELLRLVSLELFGITLYNLGILQIMISQTPNLKSMLLKRNSLRSLDYKTLMGVIDCLQQNPHRIFDLSLDSDSGNGWSVSSTLAKRLDEEVHPNVRLCALRILTLPLSLVTLYQGSLKELVISHIVHISNEMFALVCDYCVNLEKFDCSLKLVTTVIALSSLVKLTSLRLVNMYHIKDESFLCGLCSEVNTTLKDVTLHFMTEVTSECFIAFARTHPTVTQLHLISCYKLDDVSIQAIFKYQTSLRALCISACYGVTDVGFKGTVLDPSWNTCEMENPTGHSITRLADLQLLDLQDLDIDFTFLKSVKFTHLCYVGLGYTTIPLEILKLLIENHPNIKDLNVSSLPIDNDFLRLLVQKLPKLQNIVIQNCSGLHEKDTRELLICFGLSCSSKLWSKM